MVDRAKYPELAKLDAVHGQMEVVRYFLEWMGEQRIDLCTVIPGLAQDRWAPITEGHERLIARHFGIDTNAIENERRAMLKAHSESLCEGRERG